MHVYELPYQQAMSKGNLVSGALVVFLAGILATARKGKEGLRKLGSDSEPSARSPLTDLLRLG